MDDIKRCSKCDNEKELSEFTFRKETQKYGTQCRGCIRLINKEYRNMNKEEIRIRRRNYCENIKNKNLKRIYDIDHRERNRERCQVYKKKFFQNKKHELHKKIKRRKDKDIYFRLTWSLQKRVLNAFKAQKVRKTNKTFFLLGCSHSFLRLWIESQLYGEMTLENFGKTWFLDLCLPIASFNL